MSLLQWYNRAVGRKPKPVATPPVSPEDPLRPRQLAVARRLAQVNDEIQAMIASRARMAVLLPRLVYRDGLLDAQDRSTAP